MNAIIQEPWAMGLGRLRPDVIRTKEDLSGVRHVAGIAEKMASNQKQIAISEFFEKNKHFLGFDSLPRSIITAVKELSLIHI